jgi:hypothetical protein
MSGHVSAGDSTPGAVIGGTHAQVYELYGLTNEEIAIVEGMHQ